LPLLLQQVQKMLSASRRNNGERLSEGWHETLALLGGYVSKKQTYEFQRPAIKDGHLVGDFGSKTNVVDIASKIDSWTRLYGPEVSVRKAIALDQERKQRRQKQPQSGTGGQSPPDGNSSSEASQPSSGAQTPPTNEQDGPPTQTQTTGPASGRETNQPQPVPPRPRATPEQQALKAAQQAYRDAVAAAKKDPQYSTLGKVEEAKRQLRAARRMASHNAAAQKSSPSLAARKMIAGAHGRLQRVPQKLRNQMADLINRLVEQGGSVGEKLTPIPVLSTRKLVTRMMVRRPLPNALKEDSMTGRPVVLFLPDVSPSCAEQAQIACNLANAAGYAGVSGSDVLVFPHSNGIVDSDENYIPWFNGKPVATSVRQVENLFREICSGQSCYRVRVVVFIGDHDAVDEYQTVIRLKSVTRAIWLHNWGPRGDQSRPKWAEPELIPAWRPEELEKLSMVSGCINQSTMLRGFDLALR
jgi:hypothetical protein